jgi:hypothetical protein
MIFNVSKVLYPTGTQAKIGLGGPQRDQVLGTRDQTLQTAPHYGQS